MADPSQAENHPEEREDASGASDRRTRDERGDVAADTPSTTSTESEREKPALKTDPQAVADEEILADAPRDPDSAPPSIPSAAAVFSEDSTRAATSTPV